MATIKIDLNFIDSPQVVQVGPLAAWLYVCGQCYCSRHQTDGLIHNAVIPLLADFSETKCEGYEVDPFALAERLVRSGLWENVETDFRVLPPTDAPHKRNAKPRR